MKVFTVEYWHDLYLPPMLIGVFKSKLESAKAICKNIQDVKGYRFRSEYRIKEWIV